MYIKAGSSCCRYKVWPWQKAAHNKIMWPGDSLSLLVRRKMDRRKLSVLYIVPSISNELTCHEGVFWRRSAFCLSERHLGFKMRRGLGERRNGVLGSGSALHTAGKHGIWIDQSGFSRREKLLYETFCVSKLPVWRQKLLARSSSSVARQGNGCVNLDKICCSSSN